MGKRQKRFIAIIVLFLVLSTSVAYAAFSTILEFSARVNVKNLGWLTRFEDVSQPVVIGTAKEIAPPKVTYTTLEAEVELNKKGDQIAYLFDVSNLGSIDAKLNSEPLITGIPRELIGKVECTLTYSDGTPLRAYDQLNTLERRHLKFVIEYVDDTNVEETTFVVQALVLYIQK